MSKLSGGFDRDGLSPFTKQVIGGIVLMVIGAMFSFLLTSSSMQYRVQRNETEMQDVRNELAEVRRDLSNGGPAPLAQRVAKLEEGMSEMRLEIKEMYKVIVLRQPAAR